MKKEGPVLLAILVLFLLVLPKYPVGATELFLSGADAETTVGLQVTTISTVPEPLAQLFLSGADAETTVGGNTHVKGGQ